VGFHSAPACACRGHFTRNLRRNLENCAATVKVGVSSASIRSRTAVVSGPVDISVVEDQWSLRVGPVFLSTFEKRAAPTVSMPAFCVAFRPALPLAQEKWGIVTVSTRDILGLPDRQGWGL
jgi:hypothetical protein